MATKHEHEYTIKDGPSIWNLGVESLLNHPYPKDYAERQVMFTLDFTRDDSREVKDVVWRGVVHAFERLELWAGDRKFETEYEPSLRHLKACFLVVHFNGMGAPGRWLFGQYNLQKRTGWFDELPKELLQERAPTPEMDRPYQQFTPAFLLRRGGLLQFLLRHFSETINMKKHGF